MRITARAAAALLTTTIVVGGTATAASAQSTTLKDKPSDVVSFASPDDPRGTQLGYADSVASGVDLRSMRVKHTKKSLSINLKFSRLVDTTTVYASVRVDGKSTPSRLVVNTKEDSGTVLDAKGKKRCTAIATHRYGRGGSVNLVVKRSCLGDPKRVKVGAFAADPGYFEDDQPYKADAVSPSKVRGGAYTKWLTAS